MHCVQLCCGTNSFMTGSLNETVESLDTLMQESTLQKNNVMHEPRKPLSAMLIIVCIYMFLVIERPWETIRYLETIPIERAFAIFLIIMAFMNNKLKIVNAPTNKWVYGLLALHFILAPFAFNTGYAVDQGIEYAKMVVLYLLMLAVVDDEATLKVLLKAYMLTMIVYTIHCLWEYSNGRFMYRMGISRMMGVGNTFSDPNSFASSLVISLPVAYVMARFERNVWLRRLFYGYVPLVVLCVVLTGSRSATVALVILVLLWGITQKGKRKIIYLIAVLLSIAVIWNVMPEEKQIRIQTLWDKDAGPANAHASADGRKFGWIASWKMFKQRPFTGVGAGGNNFVGYRLNHAIDEIPLQSHILYGEVLAEFGAAGALFFTGLVVSIWGCCMQNKRNMITCASTNSFLNGLRGSILACLMLLLFLGFGGHNFYRPMWLWLAAWSSSLMNIANQMKSKLFPLPPTL